MDSGGLSLSDILAATHIFLSPDPLSRLLHMDRRPGLFARVFDRRPGRIWRLALAAVLGVGAVCVLVAAVVVLMLLPTLPSVQELTDADLKVPLRVYTADGELIAEFGEEKRIPVKIEDVPPQ